MSNRTLFSNPDHSDQGTRSTNRTITPKSVPTNCTIVADEAREQMAMFEADQNSRARSMIERAIFRTYQEAEEVETRRMSQEDEHSSFYRQMTSQTNKAQPAQPQQTEPQQASCAFQPRQTVHYIQAAFAPCQENQLYYPSPQAIPAQQHFQPNTRQPHPYILPSAIQHTQQFQPAPTMQQHAFLGQPAQTIQQQVLARPVQHFPMAAPVAPSQVPQMQGQAVMAQFHRPRLQPLQLLSPHPRCQQLLLPRNHPRLQGASNCCFHGIIQGSKWQLPAQNRRFPVQQSHCQWEPSLPAKRKWQGGSTRRLAGQEPCSPRLGPGCQPLRQIQSRALKYPIPEPRCVGQENWQLFGCQWPRSMDQVRFHCHQLVGWTMVLLATW